MNSRKLAALLGGSIVINILLFVQWRRVLAPKTTARIGILAERATPIDRNRITPFNDTVSIDSETWSALIRGGQDLPGFVTRLRTNGYPPLLLRAIVRAQLREQFAERFDALNATAAAEPFWRGGFYLNPNPKIARAQRALQHEMDEIGRDLLGADAYADSNTVTGPRRRFGDLPPEKIASIERINADYADLRSEVNIAGRGIVLPEDRERLVFLEQERRADIARVLTPEEFENFLLHSSATADQLRAQLAAFDPSEQEFRVLFKIHASLDPQFGVMETLSPEARRKRTEAETRLAPQIEAALGSARYADFLRTTEPAWLETNQFVTYAGLPASAIGQIVAIQQDITKRFETLRADGIGADQRNLRLTSLEQEAVMRLTPLLGGSLGDYRRMAGYWLSWLTPSPPPNGR